MKIPFLKSRNFNSHEVARTAQDVEPEIFYITAYAHGCAQMVRDAASKHFGPRFKGLNITSSNRAEYNHRVPFASKNSHHIFRVDSVSKQMHCALDLDPIGVSAREFFSFMKMNFRGEIILEADRGVVHFAPVGMEDEAFQQS